MHTNKALKTDSQRSAFSVLLSFGVYGDKAKFSGGVAHYLTRRYVYLKFKGLKLLGSSSLSLCQLVPSRLSKSRIVGLSS
jgi:hypothetical protein